MPVNFFQIRTKFRDERRPRFGVMRAREFVMKDAYSFHETQADLETYYARQLAAYKRIFARCGLRNVVDVLSSTGDMGGNIAHEFQLINEMGEDTIYMCDCGFRANKEMVDENNENCPRCGKIMHKVRGVEVGNIFQLGTKYSASMNLTYTAADGTEKHPIMGCYGIGVGRTLAAILEESADEYGPRWNMATAPFAVEVIALPDKDGRTVPLAEKIYNDLRAAGVDTLLDTRDARAGEKFADADLVAAPIRLIVSQKNLANNAIEVKYRVNDMDTSSMPGTFGVDTYIADVQHVIQKLSGK